MESKRYYLSHAIDGRVIICATDGVGMDERIGSLPSIRAAVRNLRTRGFRRTAGIPTAWERATSHGRCIVQTAQVRP